MKLLFLNPINRSYVVMPSLGLGYLASVAIRAGCEVKILNCIKEKMTYEGFGRYIGQEAFDVIGFQLFSYDLNSVRKHISIIRSVSPRSVVIAGGAHPSGDPAGTMSYLKELDYAFQCEAEAGLPLLLDILSGGAGDFEAIPGLVWRCGDIVRVNPPSFVQNLDDIPMPAWDLLLPETYPEAPHGAFTKKFPTAPIVISRGCPCKCTFCAGGSINGKRVRRRSVDNVIQELRCLAGRGIREFHIEDENFTESRDFVFEFCDRLNSEGLGMSWSLPSGIRIDKIDRETLLAMARAGCYSLAIGIEFGSDRILEQTRKGYSVATVKEKLRLFKGVGIKVTGFFMFGLPGETLVEMKQTVRLSLALPLDRAQFNIFMPLPGSVEWDNLQRGNLLEGLDWDRFFVHDVAYSDKCISAMEIKRIQRLAVLRFYLRPRILFRLLSEIRSFGHVVHLCKRTIDTLIK